MTRALRIYVAVAGLTSMGAGGGLLFTPVAFRHSVGIALERSASVMSASVMSETRAPGAALLAAGVLMLFAAVRPAYTRLALGTAALVYLSFGAGRLLSLALDGRPHPSLVIAMIVELALGAIGLLALRIDLHLADRA